MIGIMLKMMGFFGNSDLVLDKISLGLDKFDLNFLGSATFPVPWSENHFLHPNFDKF